MLRGEARDCFYERRGGQRVRAPEILYSPVYYLFVLVVGTCLTNLWQWVPLRRACEHATSET